MKLLLKALRPVSIGFGIAASVVGYFILIASTAVLMPIAKAISVGWYSGREQMTQPSFPMLSPAEMKSMEAALAAFGKPADGDERDPSFL